MRIITSHDNIVSDILLKKIAITDSENSILKQIFFQYKSLCRRMSFFYESYNNIMRRWGENVTKKQEIELIKTINFGEDLIAKSTRHFKDIVNKNQYLLKHIKDYFNKNINEIMEFSTILPCLRNLSNPQLYSIIWSIDACMLDLGEYLNRLKNAKIKLEQRKQQEQEQRQEQRQEPEQIRPIMQQLLEKEEIKAYKYILKIWRNFYNINEDKWETQLIRPSDQPEDLRLTLIKNIIKKSNIKLSKENYKEVVKNIIEKIKKGSYEIIDIYNNIKIIWTDKNNLEIVNNLIKDFISKINIFLKDVIRGQTIQKESKNLVELGLIVTAGKRRKSQ